MATLKPMTPLRPLMQANVKPPSPLHTPKQQPLKPPSPLRPLMQANVKPPSPLQPKTTPKTPISHPQRRCRFQLGLGLREQRRWWFHLRLALREQRRRRFHARDFQCTRAIAGPGRAASGRPTLQTSSNHRNSNRLARTPVTNVVNLSPKTSIFSEKADGLTTFVTTGQKSTRKTPRIDDVCNNTQRSAPKSQHDKPDHIGGPEGLAAVPVGGGRARAGLEIDHSEPQARVWRSRGRAAAHRHTQRPGPKAAQRSARNISGAASTTGARANRPYSPPPPGSGRPV